MELEKALEISGDLVKAYLPAFAGFEVAESDLAAVVERLRQHPLADLLEATRLVQAETSRLAEEARAENKSVSLHTVLADRAIAAIYTILHHDAEEANPGGQQQPLCVLQRTGMFLISLPK